MVAVRHPVRSSGPRQPNHRFLPCLTANIPLHFLSWWQGGGLSGAADLGGSIVTGISDNPLAVLARQLNLPMHRISQCVS